MDRTEISKTTIRAYGVAKDIVGGREAEMEVVLPCSVQSFKSLVVEQFPQFENINGFQLAIGESYAQEDDIVQPGDVVTIIPPVSGG